MARGPKGKKDGFAASGEQTFTIADTADGSAVAAVDLGRNYKMIVITCEDCQYIAATTTLGVEVAYDDAGAMCDLHDMDDPGTAWVSSNLPTSGTFAVVLRVAAYAQKIRLVLSNAASGGSVVFNVHGFEAGYDD